MGEYSVSVYYARFDMPLPGNLWLKYLNSLSYSLKIKNSKFRRWKDKHAHLLGKMLLLKAVRDHGMSNFDFEDISYNEYLRPQLSADIDFNISHCDGLAVCAIGGNLRLGIDVERLTDIDLSHYVNVMTDEQWNEINSNVDPIDCFLRYWVMKESVIKADGKGLSIPLTDISFRENSVSYGDQIWYLSVLEIDTNFKSYLSVNKKGTKISLKEVDFYKVNCL